MSCIHAFSYSIAQGKNSAECLDYMCPNFGCEAETCSVFSPGVVDDSEKLLFLLINPTHYDAQRETIVPDAFRELVVRDLSVIRIDLDLPDDISSTIKKLVSLGLQKAPPQERTILEGCLASGSDLREAEIDGMRVFAVYDSALNDNKSHASAFTSSLFRSSSKLRKRAINRIYEIMTPQRVKLPDH
jgi:hypothetical protein